MSQPLSNLPLRGFLDALASGCTSPGAGAAGALALALAASCGAKAATLSARHREVPAGIADRLGELTARALALAEEDGSRFEDWLQRHDDAAREALDACGRRMLALAGDIDAQLAQLRGSVTESLAGDLAAAAALVDAGRRIHGRNLAEVRTDGNQAAEGADFAGLPRTSVTTV